MDDRPQFGRCSKDNETSNENAKARKEVLNATSVIVGFYSCTRRRHCRLCLLLISVEKSATNCIQGL